MLFSNLSITLIKTAMTSFFQTNKLKVILVLLVLGVLGGVGYKIHLYVAQATANSVALEQLDEKYKAAQKDSKDKADQIDTLQTRIKMLDEILVELRETNEALKATFAKIKVDESKSIAEIKRQAIADAKKNNPQLVAGGDVYGGSAAHVAPTDQRISTVRIETITKLYCSMEVETASVDSKCPKN